MATDSFSYSDGDLSTVSSGAWTDVLGTQRVASSELAGPSSSSDSAAFFAGAASDDNHESQYTLSDDGGDHDFGPAVAMATTGGGQFYWANCFGGTDISIWDGGSYSGDLGETFTQPTEGQTVKIVIDTDGNIDVYVNGSLEASGTDTNVDPAGGQPGSFIYNSAIRLDDFVGGDVGGGGGGRIMSSLADGGGLAGRGGLAGQSGGLAA